MCFIEYIGYACGHSSVHVHRPCPLTTHLHTNPVCPRPAERPTQCHANCPACARILHVRWVEIVTLEHQWMHERGVCGCDVVFPPLQQPRDVGEVRLGSSVSGTRDSLIPQNSGTSTHHDDDGNPHHSGVGHGHGNMTNFSNDCEQESAEDHNTATTGIASLGTRHHGPDNMTTCQHRLQQPQSCASNSQISSKRNLRMRRKNKAIGKHQNSPQIKSSADSRLAVVENVVGNVKNDLSSKPIKPHAVAWDDTISSLVEIDELVEANPSIVKPATTIAIRLSSQYGAEWIPQHGGLHRVGRCKCAVVFETYQPYRLTAKEINEHAHYSFKIDQPIKALRKPSLRESDIMVWRANEQRPPEGQIEWPVQMQDFGFTSVVEAEAFLTAEATRSGVSCGSLPPGLNETLSAPCIVPSRIAVPIRICQAREGLSHEYPLYRYDYHVSQELPINSPNQPLVYDVLALEPVKPNWHQQHDLPLVGWPLGAGPEGGDENSHSPAWNMCTLSRPTLQRCQSCPPGLSSNL